MAKKLISVLLAVLLVFSLATTCFASSSEQETTEEAVLIKSNGEREYGSLKGLLANAYGTNVTVQLLKEITYQAEKVEVADPIYASYGIGGEDGVRCNLDLGGHTITVTAELDSNCISFMAISVAQYSCEIKNGTIVADVNSSGKCSETYFAGYQIAEIYTSTKLKNVALMSDSEYMDYGIYFSEGWGSSTDSRTLSLDNVTVVSEGTAIECKPGTPSGGTSKELKININSGSFKNLNLGEGEGEGEGYSVTYGTPLTVPGTNNGTSVYTSADTTAIIVDDGNAYLYDTLQDAVDAVDTSGTIQLLKQPSDGKVIVPDDPQFSIKAFDEDSEIDTTKLALATSDGKKVVVGTDGTVEVVDIPATGIALDKTSVEIFKNQTVTLTATVEPHDTTNAVTWSSSNSSVATVNENGVVTGVSQGTAIITATAGDKTASCMVTVDPTWKVMLDNELKEVLKGDPFTFPSAPTKPGYIFMGWRGADGATYQPGDEVAITGNTSFKAIWANMPDITPGTPDVPDDEPDVDVFPFYDVSAGAWYYDAVKYAWEHELMNGVSATEFSPNTTLNRAMIWTMLARLNGVNTDGGANWYAKAQEWAMAEGVSDGTDPMGAVTREQLVTMLWRFKGEPTVDFLLTAKDADTVSSWAYEAMRWAVAEGIIEGDENGMISPTATATRAQAAAIFMRFIEL